MKHIYVYLHLDRQTDRQADRQTSMQIQIYLFGGARRRLSQPRATRISAQGLCPDPVKIHFFECYRSPPLVSLLRAQPCTCARNLSRSHLLMCV
mmetsp:Transcript_67297/g.109101  ORF Transcript_67297/g.109101 Transcript_67297/m.109101 type:complete len:94 (+) Transcript_67297:326-607(+)